MVDNYIVKDGNGDPQTFRAKDVGGGIKAPLSIPSDPTGTPYDPPATQTTLAAILAKITSDPASQTTLAAFESANHTDLAAILAKLTSDPATQTTLAAILTALGTNHTDELQLHTDIATTLLAKSEAIRALLAGTLTVTGGGGGGDASAANQVTGNTSLASIDTKLSTNHTDEVQLHTDLATTLAGKLDTLHADLGTTLHADIATTLIAIFGTTTATKVVTDANGTLQQYLRGLVTLFASVIAAASTGSPAATAPAVVVTSRDTIAPVQGCTPVTIGAVVPTASANGATSSRVKAANTTNATNLKAGAGQIYSIDVFNNAAYTVFLKLYNKASSPTVGPDTPVWTIPIQAGGGFSREFPRGKTFATGISYAITKLNADSDTTVVAADDLTGSIDWI